MTSSRNEESPSSNTQADDELSFLDLVRFIRRYGAVLLCGVLIGGALGLAVAITLPAQWEASALIRVGQLGATHVEPLSRVVDRVTQKSFKDDALKRMNISSDKSDTDAGSLANNLKVKVEKSDLIGVRVLSTTPDDAVCFVDALIIELADTHTKMMEPAFTHLHKELDEIDLELEQTDKELEQLNRLINRQTESMVLLVGSIILSNKMASRELRKQKRILQEQLDPKWTFPTASLGKTGVSTQPVFPNKLFFSVSGLAIGLFMAVMLSLWRSRISVAKNS